MTTKISNSFKLGSFLTVLLTVNAAQAIPTMAGAVQHVPHSVLSSPGKILAGVAIGVMGTINTLLSKHTVTKETNENNMIREVIENLKKKIGTLQIPSNYKVEPLTAVLATTFLSIAAYDIHKYYYKHNKAHKAARLDREVTLNTTQFTPGNPTQMALEPIINGMPSGNRKDLLRMVEAIQAAGFTAQDAESTQGLNLTRIKRKFILSSL